VKTSVRVAGECAEIEQEIGE